MLAAKWNGLAGRIKSIFKKREEEKTGMINITEGL